MTDLATIKLADVAEVFSGFAFKSADLIDGGIPVIKIGNLSGGLVSPIGSGHLPASKMSKRLFRFILKNGDTLIAMTGAGSVGRVGRMRKVDQDYLVNQRVGIIRPKEGGIHPDYLGYFLLQPEIEAGFYALGVGAGQPNISPTQIGNLEVKCPPPVVQERIASILSTYDDLIENNTRRIAILEEMARRLYEEWFVLFLFPGHEDAIFTKTEHGRVPEGWDHCQLGESSSFISRGISPKYDDEADCRVINQKCIRNYRLSMALSRRQSKNVTEDKYVRFGDVLINSTGVGTLGRVAQVQEPLVNVTVDSHVTIARANDTMDKVFYGQQLLHLQPHFEDQGVGATGQTELSKTRVAETLALHPTYPIQSKFGMLVQPMKRQIQTLLSKNTNLRAQRDLLLPKLVSGEINVSEAEEAQEDAVA